MITCARVGKQAENEIKEQKYNCKKTTYSLSSGNAGREAREARLLQDCDRTIWTCDVATGPGRVRGDRTDAWRYNIM